MMECYREPARDVPLLGTWDILVIGGGAAGCAAAITAGRLGARVLLAERYGFLGGATVSQLVAHILSTNGVDFQGIWHDWIRAIRARRADAACELVGTRGKYLFRGGVDPEVVKYAWDDLVSAAGCTQLLHATVSSAIIEDGVCAGAVFDTRSGRRAVRAQRIIDCTGDAVFCDAAGIPWAQGNGTNPWNQSLTTVFRMGNVQWPTEGYPPAEVDAKRALAAEKAADKTYDCPVVANGRAVTYPLANWVHQSVAPYRTEMNVFSSRVLRVDTLDPFDMTRAEREGREQAWQCASFARAHLRGYEKAYLLDTGMHIGLRDSRRVQGLACVTKDDALSFRKRPDGIARSSWDIDIWPAESYDAPAVPRDEPLYKERMRRMAEDGEYFDIPYGCLVADGAKNLLVAGRCISAEREAQASLRIQQTCQATGEAAGFAAARSIESRCSPDGMDVSAFVRELAVMRDKIEPAFDLLRDVTIAR